MSKSNHYQTLYTLYFTGRRLHFIHHKDMAIVIATPVPDGTLRPCAQERGKSKEIGLLDKSIHDRNVLFSESQYERGPHPCISSLWKSII